MALTSRCSKLPNQLASLISRSTSIPRYNQVILHFHRVAVEPCKGPFGNRSSSARVRVCTACVHTTRHSNLTQAKLLEQTFAELLLKPIQEQVGGVRVRQHVNPLKASLVAPLPPPKWDTVFSDCTLPLTVDIGCGSGRFLMVLAKGGLGFQNFMGIDVRERLVDRAKLWAEELRLMNIHFVTTNATVGLNSLLATYPGPVELVSILCPDPHFKQRHQKRRVVQRPLVEAIVEHLDPGGRVFLQSDVKGVAIDMRQQFDEHLGRSLARCDASLCDSEGWVLENPLGLPSEREVHVLSKGERLYRLLYERL